MTLLDWLKQTPNAHLIGECFAVRNDLSNAEETLQDRAHLLPMSDTTLLNFGLGVALNGECAFVEWPSADISSIAAWIQTLPETGIGSMVIRVHIDTNIDWSTFEHPAVEVWSIATDAQRAEVLNRALVSRQTIVLLESAQSMAWHKLEGCIHEGTVTEHGNDAVPHGHHCVVISANLHAPAVQSAVDALNADGLSILWLEQHNITAFDPASLQSMFDIGRVVCVGLPVSWMSAIVAKAFWRLETEPLFCMADEADIIRSVYATLEA